MLTPICKSQRYLRVGDIGRFPQRLDCPAGPFNPIQKEPWIVIAFRPADRVVIRSLNNGDILDIRAAWAEEYLEVPGCPAYIAPPVCYETGRRKLYAAKHPADARPGHYYVSARNYSGQTALLLGPFQSHREALDKVPLGRDLANQHVPDAARFAYGTVRMADTFTQPGKLNRFA